MTATAPPGPTPAQRRALVEDVRLELPQVMNMLLDLTARLPALVRQVAALQEKLETALGPAPKPEEEGPDASHDG